MNEENFHISFLIADLSKSIIVLDNERLCNSNMFFFFFIKSRFFINLPVLD